MAVCIYFFGNLLLRPCAPCLSLSSIVTWEAVPCEWVMLLEQKPWQQKCGESDETPCRYVGYSGLRVSFLAFPFRLLPLRAGSPGDISILERPESWFINHQLSKKNAVDSLCPVCVYKTSFKIMKTCFAVIFTFRLRVDIQNNNALKWSKSSQLHLTKSKSTDFLHVKASLIFTKHIIM